MFILKVPIMIFRLFNWKVNAVNCSGYATFAMGEQT